MATALRTPSRITTSCLSTLRWMTRTPSRTRTRTTRSSEHTARRPLMHIGLTSHLWLNIASCVSSMSSMHAHLWLVSWVVCLLPCVLRLLPRLTVLLPALPDVHLSAQRQVHVQTPVLLQLGERGHIRLRHTPHILDMSRKPDVKKRSEHHHMLCRPFHSFRRGRSADGDSVHQARPRQEEPCVRNTVEKPCWNFWNMFLKDWWTTTWNRISFGCNRCGGCKWNTSCTWYSRTFYDIQRLRNTAYIFTHNIDNPERTVTNCTNTTMHNDANTAQFWARRAPSLDALHSCVHYHIWLKSRLCVFISIHGHRHAHLFLSVAFFLVSLYLVLKSFFHLFLNPAMVPDENFMEDPLCNSSFGRMVSPDYVTPDTEWDLYAGDKPISALGTESQQFQTKVRSPMSSRVFQNIRSVRYAGWPRPHATDAKTGFWNAPMESRRP